MWRATRKEDFFSLSWIRYLKFSKSNDGFVIDASKNPYIPFFTKKNGNSGTFFCNIESTILK